MVDKVNLQGLEKALLGEPGGSQLPNVQGPADLSIYERLLAPPAAPSPTPQSGVAGDLARSLGGGLTQGTSFMTRGLGRMSDFISPMFNPFEAADRFLGTDLLPAQYETQAVTGKAADWLTQKSQGMLKGRSPETIAAIAKSQINGTLWKPSTWNWGTDPSLRGLGNQMVETLGQLVPIVVVGAVSGPIPAAVAGGAQGGEAGRAQAEQAIQEAYDSGVLQDVSPQYRKLVESGVNPQQALARVQTDAGDLAQLIVTPISALGGAATAKIFRGEAVKNLAGNLVSRVFASGTIGAVEEGTQEVAESLGATAGVRLASGVPQDFGEGTLADFVMGALAGGPVGAVGGFAAPRRTEPITVEQIDDLSDEDLGTGDGTAPLPDDPSEDPEDSLVTHGDGPIAGVESPTAATPEFATPEEELLAKLPQNEVDPNTDLVDITDIELDDDILDDLSFEPEPEPSPTPSDPYKGELTGLTYLAPKDGTAKGGIYIDNNGTQYIAKSYPDNDQASSELLASKVFGSIFGALNSLPQIVDTSKEKVLLNKWFYDAVPFDPENPDHVAMAKQHFVLNAWLANWDVFGKDFDNVLVIPGDSPQNVHGSDQLAYVDLGGALDFRAMGKKKGLAFGNTVPEIYTLLDHGKNFQSASVYNGITLSEIEQQVQYLYYLMIGDGELQNLIEQSELSNEEKEKLFVKLQKRALWLLQKYWPEADYVEIQEGIFWTKPKGEKLKLSFPAPAPAVLDNQIKKLEDEADVYQAFNEKFIKSFADAPATNATIEAILNNPLMMDLMLNNKNFHQWIKGNKLWWSLPEKKLVLSSDMGKSVPTLFTNHGFLPPVLFHGSKSINTNQAYWDNETQSWQLYDAFDPKHKGTATGGGDTHLGMFFSDNPFIAYQYVASKFMDAFKSKPLSEAFADFKRSPKGGLMPMIVNLNPYPIDNDGNAWSSSKHIHAALDAKDLGYDSLLSFNMVDSGGMQNQIIVFDPSGKNIKSPYAKAFNPESKIFKASYAGVDHTWVTLTKEDKDALAAEMKKIGIDRAINLDFFAADGKYKGKFTKDVKGLHILLSAAMPIGSNPLATLRHEAIHALKAIGFFDTLQGKKMWKVLASEAKITKHIRENYDPADHLEEAIAELMEEWSNRTSKPDPKNTLDQVMMKIHQFFVALKNWILGRGFQTPDQVFEYITNGSAADTVALLTLEDRLGSGLEQEIASAVKAAKSAGVTSPDTAKADYFTRLTKHGWTIIQLAKKNLHIPWLQEYVQHASQWHGEKMKWLSHANETASRWNNLPPKQQEALANTLFDVEQMIYRSQKEIDDGIVRKPTKNELIGIFKKNNLSKQGVELYVQVRLDFDTMLNKIEQVAIQSIKRTLAHDILGQQLETAKIQKEFKLLRRAPYFPHARFGEFTVVVKDKEGKTVYAEMFEREKSRNDALASINSKFPQSKGFTVAASKLSEEAQVYRGIPQALLIAMKHNLKLNAKQMQALEEMIIHSAPAISFKNHFVKKDNIAGYSRDALRAYADYFWHGANHIARIEYGPLMEESILNGDNDIKALIGVGADSTKRVKVLDFVKHHFDAIMNPQEDWAALRSVGFMWWLGFNVKSAVLNFTQVPMVTYSHLAANFNDVGATAELAKSMTQLRRMFSSPAKAQSSALKADLDLIQRGIREGFLDESFAAMLAGLAEGSNLTQSMAKTQLRKRLIQFNHAAGWMFQTTEKINRRVSFMAAVNLARKNPKAEYLNEVRKRFSLEYKALLDEGLSPTEATAFLAGKDTVESTQFNYSAWARPRVMEGRKSAFLTFFMFTQNMLWFIKNSPGNTRYLLLLLMFAGLQGMPGAEDAEELVKAVGAKAFGKEWNAEKELRALLIELMGEDGPPPDLFLHGISRYGFGLPLLGDLTGLPIPTVDMSGSIGMGSPVPVISPAIQAGASVAQGKEFDESLGRFTQEGVGATLGIPISLLQVLADSRMEVTDRKRWENFFPASLSGISKAMRFYTEGSDRTRTSAEIIEYDRNNPEHMAEIVARAAGFALTRTSQTWDKTMMQREAELFWNTRRGMLLRQYDFAKERGDDKDVEDVKNAIRRFNQEVPTSGLKIGGKTLSRSRKQRELARAKAEQGRARTKMMEGVYREIGELHPELKVTESEEDLPSGR